MKTITIQVRPKRCKGGWYPELTLPNGQVVRACEVSDSPESASITGMKHAMWQSHKLRSVKRDIVKIIKINNSFSNGVDYVSIPDPKGIEFKKIMASIVSEIREIHSISTSS